MQCSHFHRLSAKLPSVWGFMRTFSSTNKQDATNNYHSEKIIVYGNSDVSQVNRRSVTVPNQHVIQFQLSSTLSARLDVAIASHFRVSGTAISDNAQSPIIGNCHKSTDSHMGASPLKDQRFRGRQGRQHHRATKSDSLREPSFSASTPSHVMQKNISEDSRRKLYERRRAERQRLHESEFDQNNRHKSEIDCAMEANIDEDEEEIFAVQSKFASSAPISVNNNDFDYHVNVTAALASRQRVSQLIENRMVSVNGSTVISKSHTLAEGVHSICVSLPFGSTDPYVSSSSAFPFPILYEDESLLVICKPPGIVVHPTPHVHDSDVPSVVSRLLQQGFLLPASQSAIHRFKVVYELILSFFFCRFLSFDSCSFLDIFIVHNFCSIFFTEQV